MIREHSNMISCCKGGSLENSEISLWEKVWEGRGRFSKKLWDHIWTIFNSPSWQPRVWRWRWKLSPKPISFLPPLLTRKQSLLLTMSTLQKIQRGMLYSDWINLIKISELLTITSMNVLINWQGQQWLVTRWHLTLPLCLLLWRTTYTPSAQRAPHTLFSCYKKMLKLARVDTVNFVVWPDDSIINC